MASNYNPAAGTIKIQPRTFTDIVKANLSANPRQFRTGAMLWLNKVVGRYQAEPANISAQTPGTDFTASTSNPGDTTSLAHCQGVFAPLFLGIAAGGRIPQQLNSWGQFGAPGNAVNANMDASPPFQGYYENGIVHIPVGPSLSSTGVLTAAIDEGTLVAPDGFENNDGTVGFYDEAGAKHSSESAWYLYDNCVTTTAVAANAIGIVYERAEIGSPILIVKFKSAVFSTRLGGV